MHSKPTKHLSQLAEVFRFYEVKTMTPSEYRALKELESMNGRTTVFWAMETFTKASAITRLERRGVIVTRPDLENGFPSVVYTIKPYSVLCPSCAGKSLSVKRLRPARWLCLDCNLSFSSPN